jgi:predicted phage terminase large subunit-like protein
LGREEGDALFPEMKPKEFVRQQMVMLGSYLSNALYGASPTLAGGNYLDASKIKIINEDEIPEGLRWRCRFWDLGATEADELASSDPSYTVGIRGAMFEGCFYLSGMVRGQWDWTRSRERIKETALCEASTVVGIEAVGGFKTAMSNLREVMPPTVRLLEYSVDKDKLTRALPWIALAEAGKVFCVAGSWVPGFKEEVNNFPAGTHDDQVDAVSGVYKMLSGAAGLPAPQPGSDRRVRAVAERTPRALVG